MKTTAHTLSEYLKDLHLAGMHYYLVVESTNDQALAWANEGAKDWSLIVGDTQTQGRGRGDRRWVTIAGTSLAISLVLRLDTRESAVVTRFTALAALSLIRTLAQLGVVAKIKWPNDVLIENKKVAGVLVETDWEGDQINALVIGIGVNICADSLPDSDKLRYPATSIEEAVGKPIDRWVVLKKMLVEMMNLRPQLKSDEFIEAWNQSLAFSGSWVQFKTFGQNVQRMNILGVRQDGCLLLEQGDGQIQACADGEIIMGNTITS
jgi:BirA family biotin operon repressor/biotin-[acetyl-CoA-carboxylase] ligase